MGTHLFDRRDHAAQGIGTTEIGKCSASTGGRTIDIGGAIKQLVELCLVGVAPARGQTLASVTEADRCVVD